MFQPGNYELQVSNAHPRRNFPQVSKSKKRQGKKIQVAVVSIWNWKGSNLRKKNYIRKVWKFEGIVPNLWGESGKSIMYLWTAKWNGPPTKLRMQPKITFKKKIQKILFNILESEDNNIDLETLIRKVKLHHPSLFTLA